MNTVSLSDLCCLLCCPPCPSRIAAKLGLSYCIKYMPFSLFFILDTKCKLVRKKSAT
jgi:hypothetical protein